MTVKIEAVTAPGCGKCAKAESELRAIAASVLGDGYLAWRDVNVFEELDYAVSLGVLTMPAIVVNGELIFSSLPTPEQFRATLLRLELC